MAIDNDAQGPSENNLAKFGPDSSPMVVSLGEYKGNRFLDIRRYYRKKGSDDLLPTKKGIAFNASNLVSILSVVDDNRASILSWLNGADGSVKETTERNLQTQLEAKTQLAREPRSFGIENYHQRDQRFFDCSSEGAIDNIKLNSTHVLFEFIEKHIEKISKNNEKDQVKNNINEILGSVLIAYYRAKVLLSGEGEISANDLFDSLEYEWGVILKNYAQYKH